MWYFSWILGTGLALAFAVLNAIWYEITDIQSRQGENRIAPRPADAKPRDPLP